MQKPTRAGRARPYLLPLNSLERAMTEIFLGLGANGERQTLRLSRANRHGLIAGATGTGKTVTLQTIAEQFSAAGRAGVHGRREGRSFGHCHAGSHDFKHAAKLEARAAEGLASPITPIATIRRCSGTSTASRAIRSAPPFPKWGRCCWRG
jgi:hypothetical protein